MLDYSLPWKNRLAIAYCLTITCLGWFGVAKNPYSRNDELSFLLKPFSVIEKIEWLAGPWFLRVAQKFWISPPSCLF